MPALRASPTATATCPPRPGRPACRLTLAEELAPREAGGDSDRPRPSPDKVKSLLRRQGPAGGHEEKKVAEKKKDVEDREKREVEGDEPEPRGRRGGHVGSPVSGGGFGALGLGSAGGPGGGGPGGGVHAVPAGAPRAADGREAQAEAGPRAGGGGRPAFARESFRGPVVVRGGEAGRGRAVPRGGAAGVPGGAVRAGPQAAARRYEPTRTNGEYVRQVYLAEQCRPTCTPLSSA